MSGTRPAGTIPVHERTAVEGGSSRPEALIDIYRSAAGRRILAELHRERLARSPIPLERHRVPARDGDAFVLAAGAGSAPPLVLLHGAATDSTSWLSSMTVLASRFRVLAVDIIGEAGNSAPVRPPPESGRYAAWLDAVLDGCGVADVVVLAASLGGWIALDHAVRRPGRITRMVLLSPNGIGRQRWAARVASTGLPLGGAPGRVLARYLLGPGLRAVPDADRLVADTATIARHFRPRTDPLPLFTDEQLAGIRAALLAVVGTRDVLIDAAQTCRRLREHTAAAVRPLPGIGHLIPPQGDLVPNFLLAERD
ncbi:alpha/beta fold hydrolase [Nocardia blacklockiae]|uniref:alpha/beta fold hydrolase n=1 Tax=Nocardia blacklockiae TaxID=480036 RepID=UPI001894A44D|nr:alpha/beta fold hydrolase [Nocardia blacklockiae]MBF6171209.1 alpha/beta fold hydrolase [Nocardia blacklockiae]